MVHILRVCVCVVSDGNVYDKQCAKRVVGTAAAA